MGENITQIKVGDDVRCISLDTKVIDTATFGFDASVRLGVRLGSSMLADNSGIGVKIHTDTQNYLKREPGGLSLKLGSMADAMAEAMAEAVADNLGLAIDGYNNLKIGTKPLKLGTGLIGGDNGKTLCLSLGSGLGFHDGEGQTTPKVVVKLLEGQSLAINSTGELLINYGVLAGILERDYGFVRNK